MNLYRVTSIAKTPARGERPRLWRALLSRTALLRGGLMLALAASGMTQAHEAGLTGHQQISTAVREFLESHYEAERLAGSSVSRVEITVAGLDPRLQIQPCGEALQTRLNQQQAPVGRTTVRVECHDESPWTRYVTASVQVFQPVVYTSRPLARGARIGAADVELQETDISMLRGTILLDVNHAIGLELRRNVGAGSALSADALAPPVLVARGDQVVITAQRGPVAIRQPGIALQNGEKGRQINVRNTSSNRVIQAVVTGPGEAMVVF